MSPNDRASREASLYSRHTDAPLSCYDIPHHLLVDHSCDYAYTFDQPSRKGKPHGACNTWGGRSRGRSKVEMRAAAESMHTLGRLRAFGIAGGSFCFDSTVESGSLARRMAACRIGASFVPSSSSPALLRQGCIVGSRSPRSLGKRPGERAGLSSYNSQSFPRMT